MKKLGIFGFPISHSLSPSIHNRAFQKAGLDWIYDLWPTKPEELQQAIAWFRSEGCLGANVTIPHKETIIAYLDTVTLTAQKIGAVNTLFWDGDKLTGDNTDAAGFLADLADQGVKLRHKTALILGAGGSAKAIKYALEQSGMMSVETWTRKSGEALIPKDLTVNCTPGLDSELLTRVRFQPGQVLYDLVYVPEETPLMNKARKDGALAFNGKGMLLAQAALSFERWKQSSAID
jgi:shikimate dehydrogenase